MAGFTKKTPNITVGTPPNSAVTTPKVLPTGKFKPKVVTSPVNPSGTSAGMPGSMPPKKVTKKKGK